MHLTHITFTGADDSVDPSQLAALSKRFPLIEWGILFSLEREGSPRYPSAAWRRDFYRAVPSIRRAAHLCGVAMLNQLAEKAPALRQELEYFQRVQLNFNAQRLPPATLEGLVTEWRTGQLRSSSGSYIEFITQHNPDNAVVYKLFAHHWIVPHMNHAVLFHGSGGNGVTPDAWPSPLPAVPCGYAGGLTPENLPVQLDAIMAAATAQRSGPDFVWVDMESGVRTHDQFDLTKVVSALEAIESRVAFSDQREGDLVQECRYLCGAVGH